jgi:hypothetical protein
MIAEGIHPVPKRDDTAYGSRRGGRDDVLRCHAAGKFAQR